MTLKSKYKWGILSERVKPAIIKVESWTFNLYCFTAQVSVCFYHQVTHGKKVVTIILGVYLCTLYNDQAKENSAKLLQFQGSLFPSSYFPGYQPQTVPYP